MSLPLLNPAAAPSFPSAAKRLLEDSQLRKNLRYATDTIVAKRARVVAEQQDWQQLRESAEQIRRHTMQYLDAYLEEFERKFQRAGGKVHWAKDADEANRIIVGLVQQGGSKEVIKIKTMTSEEIGLNPALQAVGIHAYETDLAELIIQLGNDRPSHIVVPALHKNRQQVRELFMAKMGLSELGDRPQDLADVARLFLREKFFRVKVGVSGANFLIAETGGICIVESEGNGRMCLTLPDVLITVAGIDKVLPRFQDLEVFLQLLPRSATGERMNPYNSIWTGANKGDGPQELHVVLLDNARSEVLQDSEARQTLHCIRCGACQNACPVYTHTGGHAYGSVYAGPIGAILTPQLQHMQNAKSLPYASSLCGACFEVCPVRINIPEVLIHLRGRIVRDRQHTFAGKFDSENATMQTMALIFQSRRRFEAVQRLARMVQRPFIGESGWIQSLPGTLSGWTQVRDLRPISPESFRQWWSKRPKSAAHSAGQLNT